MRDKSETVLPVPDGISNTQCPPASSVPGRSGSVYAVFFSFYCFIVLLFLLLAVRVKVLTFQITHISREEG